MGETSLGRFVEAEIPQKGTPKQRLWQTPSPQLLQGNTAAKPSLKQGRDGQSLELLGLGWSAKIWSCKSRIYVGLPSDLVCSGLAEFQDTSRAWPGMELVAEKGQMDFCSLGARYQP